MENVNLCKLKCTTQFYFCKLCVHVFVVEDLFCTPGRTARPPRIVVIVRGPPGSGKTYVSKLLKVNSLFKEQSIDCRSCNFTRFSVLVY